MKKEEMKRKGRRGALQSLREAMREMEAGDLKKVTVAAPDSEGLKEGLKMAESKVDEMEEMTEESEEEKEEESSEDDELESLSKEELVEKLKELME